MALPTSAAAIYDRLTNDATLFAALGTYTLAGGAQQPAIAVLRQHERLPEGTTTEGVEVVITAIPAFSPELLLTGETRLLPSWEIRCILWSGATDQLVAVTQRVIALLPGCTSQFIAAPPGDTLGVLDQTVIRWQDVATSTEA